MGHPQHGPGGTPVQQQSVAGMIHPIYEHPLPPQSDAPTFNGQHDWTVRVQTTSAPLTQQMLDTKVKLQSV